MIIVSTKWSFVKDFQMVVCKDVKVRLCMEGDQKEIPTRLFQIFLKRFTIMIITH